jgi:hypothetical protein
MGWPPRASIEHIDRMLVYGPTNPNSLSSIETWLASLAVRGEKLDGDPQIGQPACWRCSRESLFLRSCEIHPNLLSTREKLLYADYVRYIWSGSICGSSVESVCHIGQVFPCRVYIDSNHRDSQIRVPLVCGSHHVDNLMNSMR